MGLLKMELIKFRFKDGTLISIHLAPHVAAMWRTERETIKALQKFGKIEN